MLIFLSNSSRRDGIVDKLFTFKPGAGIMDETNKGVVSVIIVNNKHKLTWKEGMTVRDVLDEMNYIYPRITVSVNNQLVAKEDYDTYLVPDNADVNVFHLAHGG